MKWIYSKIEQLKDKQVSSLGLAIFRIAFLSVLFFEILQLLEYRELIFDRVPHLVASDISPMPILLAWLVSVFFVIIGLFSKFFKVLNYLLTLFVVGTISTYEYHMFYVYLGVNFLMMFMPVENELSLDRLLQKLKYSNTRFLYKPSSKVSILNYHVMVLVAIAFVYVDSIFYKIESDFWMKGLGMWLPATLPQISILPNSFLLNNVWLMKCLGFLTVAFEASFIFLFFRKKWRIPLLIIGIGLHLGILICFPIPLFALGVIALYLLMVPLSFWKKIGGKIFNGKPVIAFYYDAECPLCIRTKIIINHLDWFNKIEFRDVQTHHKQDDAINSIDFNVLVSSIYSANLNSGKLKEGLLTYRRLFLKIPVLVPVGLLLFVPGIYHLGKMVYGFVAKNRLVERCTEDNCGYTPPQLPVNTDEIKVLHGITIGKIRVGLIMAGLVFISLLQLNTTFTSLFFERMANVASVEVPKPIKKLSKGVMHISKVVFGITKHAVFMDFHFKDYTHIKRIEVLDDQGNSFWLPILSESGQPQHMIYGFNWVKWTFRVAGPMASEEDLRIGVRDFTSHWAHNHGYHPGDLRVRVWEREIILPKDWEYNYLENQFETPWELYAKGSWKNGLFTLNKAND